MYSKPLLLVHRHEVCSIKTTLFSLKYYRCLPEIWVLFQVFLVRSHQRKAGSPTAVCIVVVPVVSIYATRFEGEQEKVKFSAPYQTN